jgi:hypothetical protein
MSWIPKKSTTAMGWGAPAQIATPVATLMTPRTAVCSLEMPVVMSVRRLPAPVYGTLIDINAQSARVRSLVLMERGAEVEFDLAISGNAPITLNGRVVRDLEQRNAASRSIQNSIAQLPTTDRTKRGSYRALTAFPAYFRREGATWGEGKVGDISASGIRMNCEELIAIGTMIDLRVTLPSTVLDVYPEETAVLDLTQSVPRRIGRADMRRPFEEMALRGRVVTRFQPVRDREVYGVAFIEIDGYQREEIARFTHAVQLSKIRSA